MKKGLLLAMASLLTSFGAFAQIAPITGTLGACVGATTTLHDSTTGGTWYSMNTSVATINNSTGAVHGIVPGTTTILYILPPDTAYATFTVSPIPAAITGPSSLCPGTTASFADAVTGGTWSSTNTSVGTITSTTGIYTAVMSSSGTNIRYSTGTGCYVSYYVTNLVGAVGPVSGTTSTVCVGSTITVSDSSSSGAWSSSNPSIATVVATGTPAFGGSIGTVTGVSAGTAVITYTIVNSCGTYTATYTVTVTAGSITPAAIAGPTTVASGSTIALTDATAGGTWSISPSAVATINATTGVVTGVATGSAVATYTVPGCGGTSSSVTYAITVTPMDIISGTINFGSAAYAGPVKVWLITYVSPMLTAVDSVTVIASGTSAHYQFLGKPTDSFLVKAATPDSTAFGATTGYIPTYHTSSFYWYTANYVAHIAGTSDLNKDINMAYGTVTSGPGFVGGNVGAGANKGTTTTVPVKGLMMYIFNSTTMQLQAAVRTDASGNYSFSNLPVGTYYVFPDSLNYLTTPYTAISITAAAPSFSAASFIQHTLSHTITPIPVGISNVSAATASILAFPNPTNGKVNITWQLTNAQQGAVVISDIAGREVYKTNINMTSGAGNSQIDLSSLNNGLYSISVKSEAVNYNSKIQVQH